MITRPNPDNNNNKEPSVISDLENEILRLKQLVTDNVNKTQTIVKKNSDVNKTLFAISNAVNSTSNLDELFASIHTSLARIIELPNFYIALYHKEKDCITIPYYQDTKHKNWESMVIEDVSITKKPSSTCCVIVSGTPLLYNRYNYRQVCRQFNMSEIGVLSEVWMGTPLKINNEVIGVIVAQSYTNPDLYDENDLDIFISVSDQVALAIDRKRAEEALRQSELVTRTLFSISNAVNSSQTLGDLYQKIHFSLSDIIDVTNFAIAIYDNQKDILSFPYMVDEKDVPHPDIENAVQSGILNAEVIRTKKPRFLNKKDIIKRQKNGCRKVGTNPEQWLGVPLIVKNNVIGVLVVQSYTNPHLYHEKDVKLLVSISNQMAIAIDRKRAENELIKSEKKYRSMIESMTDAVYICSPDKKIQYMNPKMVERLDRDRTGEPCYTALHGLDHQCDNCIFDMDFKTNRQMIETKIVSPLDNNHYRVTNIPIVNADETVSKMTIYRDITQYVKAVSEKENTQKQLIQSQKMESIGTLAGGIAHDFNNILSVILGFTELALESVDKETSTEDYLKGVYTAGVRAKDLVQQILTFARQSDEGNALIQVNSIIKEVLKFIRSSIPTSIDIKQNIASDSYIMGNSAQLHRIMMNLCTNASQAMENSGGTLDISLQDLTFDQATLLREYHLKPGNYIEIKVSDTGVGIEPHIIDNIFEPYFTTKGTGEGTGMGLAMVHGIVETYGGRIFVESTLEKGTVFTIWLPAVERGNTLMAYKSSELSRGKERILFVDDEVQIAKMADLILRQLGYSVTTITDSLEALELFRSKPNDFDLVISDVTMPKLSGDQLSKKILEIRPDFPVILSTGYSKRFSEKDAFDIGVKALTYKPIVKEDLAAIVRKILDGAND